jgi:hypothetical protein
VTREVDRIVFVRFRAASMGRLKHTTVHYFRFFILLIHETRQPGMLYKEFQIEQR